MNEVANVSLLLAVILALVYVGGFTTLDLLKALITHRKCRLD